jgi:uncharacterized membrane protein (DUF106 family)
MMWLVIVNAVLLGAYLYQNFVAVKKFEAIQKRVAEAEKNIADSKKVRGAAAQVRTKTDIQEGN